ncbi:MAG: SIMPL domain-containing protein [Gammaproteobacteria bacterium]
MLKKSPLSIFILAFALLQTFTLHADDKRPMNQVNFQIDVDQEVENDQINATLSINENNKNPARLADEINQAMSWAMKIAKKADGVKVKSGSYQTYPVYDKKRITSWRGRQDLQLEASEVSQLSELVGTLQERLQVQSMRFSVSRQRQREVQEKLTEKALSAFKDRAQLIAKSLDSRGYDIETISVQTSGQQHMPRMRMESMSYDAQAKSAPAMEAGTSKVQVIVSGAIKLRR